MRDTFALALVRAELCRAYAADQPRVRRMGWNARARAIIERTLRSIRAPSRSLAVADPGGRRSGAAPQGTSPHD